MKDIIKSKIQDNRDICFQIFLNFIFLLFTYGMFLKTHFSLDTYSCYYNMDPGIHIKQSRFLNYLFIKLFQLIGINTVELQSIFTFFLIIILSITTVCLTNLLFKYIKKKNVKKFILVNLCVLLSFVNVYILEWFLYPEITFFYGLSILSVLIAINAIVQNQRVINIIISFLLLFCSLNFYQAAMPFYIIYSLLIIMLKSEFQLNKKSIISVLKVLLIGFGSCATMLAIQKLVIIFGVTTGGDRDASLTFETLVNNIRNILFLQKSIWYNTYGFLPEYFLFFSFIIMGIILIKLFKNHFIYQQILFFVVILFISYGIVFAPHLVTETLWFAPRTIVAFFSIFTIMGVTIIYNYKKERIANILALLLVVFISTNYLFIQYIGLNHFATNKLDQEYAHLIQRSIEEYEKNTGNQIKYIAAINDNEPTYKYYGIEYTVYDTNVRAYTINWADVNLINYYTKKNYKKVPMKKNIYNKYFKDKNWSSFNPKEQFVFQDDTLNIVFY